MTLLNRLGRLFGGDAAEQGTSRQTRDLLLICEQIRQHLAQGGGSCPLVGVVCRQRLSPPHIAPSRDRRLGQAKQRGAGTV